MKFDTPHTDAFLEKRKGHTVTEPANVQASTLTLEKMRQLVKELDVQFPKKEMNKQTANFAMTMGLYCGFKIVAIKDLDNGTIAVSKDVYEVLINGK